MRPAAPGAPVARQEQPVEEPADAARYSPPMPCGAATIATTRSAAEAMGTIRSARRSVNGIVVTELRHALHEHRRGDDAGRGTRPADDDDRDELERLEEQERVLGADRTGLQRQKPRRRDRRSRRRSRRRAALLGPGSTPKQRARVLDVAHGEERAPRLRDGDSVPHDEDDRQRGEREEVEAHVAVAGTAGGRASVRPRSRRCG